MTGEVTVWQVVCPDGVVRDGALSFSNEARALAVSRYRSTTNIGCCDGGEHSVRSHVARPIQRVRFRDGSVVTPNEWVLDANGLTRREPK